MTTRDIFTVIDPDLKPVEGYRFSYNVESTADKSGTCNLKLLHNISITLIIIILVILMSYLAYSFRKPDSLDNNAEPETILDSANNYLCPKTNVLSPSNATKSIATLPEITANRTETSIPKYLIEPSEYEIYLKLTSNLYDRSMFRGNVSIKLRAKEEVNHIVIGASNLRIISVQLFSSDVSVDEKKYNASIDSYDDVEGILVIRVNEFLKPYFEYVLRFEFDGDVQNMPYGLFKVTYTISETGEMRNLIASNTNVPFARTIFPCFDIPTQTATYQLNICQDESMITAASSNHSISDTYRVHGCTWQRFSASKFMPVHVFGFVTSNYYFHREKTNEDHEITIWTLQQSSKEISYVMNIVPKLLANLENYFGIDLPTKSIDVFAMPVIFPYSTSKLGIIMAADSKILVKENETSIYEKRQVALTVASHLIEQWIEMLITFEESNDEWLNESLVQYLKYIAVDSIESEWQIFHELFETVVLKEMDNDILSSNKKPLNVLWIPYVKRLNKQKPLYPISDTSIFRNQENYLKILHSANDESPVNPVIYSELFARKSVLKGIYLLRMLQHALTEPVFRNSLKKFLQFSSGKIVQSDDLWNLMTLEATNTSLDGYQLLPTQVSVKVLVNEWIFSNDYPIIQAIRGYDEGTVSFVQFFDNQEFSDSYQKRNFRYLSISFTTEEEKRFSETTPKLWLKPMKRTTINNPTNLLNDSWLLINPQRTNSYRVNYDETNWKMLKNGLENSQFPALVRAELFDDALFLGRRGYLDYEFALNMTLILPIYGENEYIVWITVLRHLKYIENILNSSNEENLTKYRTTFQTYVKQLITTVYESFSYPQKINLRIHRYVKIPNPDHNNVLLQSELHIWACKVGIDKCISKVKKDFYEWKQKEDPDDENSIDSNIRYATLCNAMYQGDLPDFKFLYLRYQNASLTDPNKFTYLKSLYCFKQINYHMPSILPNTLLNVHTSTHLNEVSDLWRALIENPIVSTVPFDYLVTYWRSILKKFGGFTPIMQNIIEGALINIQNEDQLNTIYKLREEINGEYPQLKQTFDNVIQIIKRKIYWKRNQLNVFITWLDKIVGKM